MPALEILRSKQICSIIKSVTVTILIQSLLWTILKNCLPEAISSTQWHHGDMNNPQQPPFYSERELFFKIV